MSILKVSGINHSYGKSKQVLKDVAFEFIGDSVVGLLGPNGAGKSTLAQIIMGLIRPNTGDVYFKDEKITTKNWTAIKACIGYVPQELSIIENLSAYENVKFFGSIYGLKGKQLEECALKALDFVQLSSRAKDLPSQFSGGMKRRLNMACGLVHDPDLIIMDEPTVGVDPQSRNSILQSIGDLSRTGKSIVYISHYMEEVESLCRDILIMDDGKIICDGNKSAIKQIHGYETIEISTDQPVSEEIKLDLVKKYGESVNFTADCELKLSVKEDSAIHFDYLNKILNSRLKKVFINDISLESVFLNLTGRTLDREYS